MKQNTLWYREPYVWLVLSPLMIAVVTGLAMLTLASRIDGSELLPGGSERVGKLVTGETAGE